MGPFRTYVRIPSVDVLLCTPPSVTCGRRRTCPQLRTSYLSKLFFSWRNVLLASMAMFLLGSTPSWSVSRLPAEAGGIGIDPTLGAQVPPQLEFVDHNGKTVQLGSYFRAGRPLLLTLNYYTCATLCSISLNELNTSLQSKELGFLPGADFQIVTVSINPRDTAALAHDKRDAYLTALQAGLDTQKKKLPPETWAFLTGSEPSIRALAQAVGFKYRYDAATKQYNHAAGVFVLTPEGKISQVLYSIHYDPIDTLRPALVEASQGKLGTIRDKFLWWCFHYDPEQGKYVLGAKMVMKIGALLTILVLGGFLTYLWRKEYKARRIS